MERESGFYWVRRGWEWVVAEWNGRPEDLGFWEVVGNENMFDDDDIDEIGDRIEPPKGK